MTPGWSVKAAARRGIWERPEGGNTKGFCRQRAEGAAVCLSCSRTSKKASVARVERGRKSMKGTKSQRSWDFKHIEPCSPWQRFTILLEVKCKPMARF